MNYGPTLFLTIAALLGSGLTPSDTQAQVADAANGFSCVANNPRELQRYLDTHPGALQQAMEAKATLDEHTRGFQKRGERNSYVIPVVVHIIHNNGLENIADEQVYDAIRILNDDYNKQNPDWPNVHPDFVDRVGDVGIKFRLAQKDPQGACTNGITRTVSSLTNVGDFEMTQLIQWPRDRYMNVWVAAVASGAAGYTYYPQWLNNWPEADGIVVLSTYMGSIGTSSPSRSRVLSHEVGHWLNLKHAWGDSNEPGDESNCFMDDEVEDTPLTRGWTACVMNGASCGSLRDNVENYMEYAYCSKMFTEGQADRMIAALTSPIAQRNSLWQAANLLQTGVSGTGYLCVAQFSNDRYEVCAGNSVAFRDESYNNIVERFWSFPGGTPASSSDPSPVVSYNEPGTYAVSMSVGDGTNATTVEKLSLITVLPSIGQAVPFAESFENQTSVDVDWVIRDRDGDGSFQVSDAAAFTGARSIRLSNSAALAGRFDDLGSSSLDMSQASSIRISYRYAYAQRSGSNDDRLRVFVSRDCGVTWSLRQHLRGGSTLSTAGIVPGPFIPNGPEQWGYAEIENISAAYHTNSFRIRFEFHSDGGNDLYLDDININGQAVGISAIEQRGGGSMAIVPNPAKDQAHVVLVMEDAGELRLELLDALGRSVAAPTVHYLMPGPQRVELPVQELASGSYILVARMPNDRRFTQAFVLE